MFRASRATASRERSDCCSLRLTMSLWHMTLHMTSAQGSGSSISSIFRNSGWSRKPERRTKSILTPFVAQMISVMMTTQEVLRRRMSTMRCLRKKKRRKLTSQNTDMNPWRGACSYLENIRGCENTYSLCIRPDLRIEPLCKWWVPKSTRRSSEESRQCRTGCLEYPVSGLPGL